MATTVVMMRPHGLIASRRALQLNRNVISSMQRQSIQFQFQFRRAAPSPTKQLQLLLHLPPLRPVSSSSGHHQRRNLSSSSSVQFNNNSNSGSSIDSPLMHSMETKIKEHLNAESVIVKDAYGDGRHVSINVISSAFEGQSAVNRQRMVYKAIWEELQDTVHAVDQMTTKTPIEAAAEK